MAFVYSRGNILFRGPNGEMFRLQKDAVANVPEWAAKTAYFEALIKDGKIVTAELKKDSKIADEIIEAEVKEQEKTKALIEEHKDEEPEKEAPAKGRKRTTKK